MAEYIDREEFIQHIEESDLPDMAKRAVIALVKHMPAADVVQGEWISHEGYDECKLSDEVTLAGGTATIEHLAPRKINIRTQLLPKLRSKDGRRKEERKWLS